MCRWCCLIEICLQGLKSVREQGWFIIPSSLSALRPRSSTTPTTRRLPCTGCVRRRVGVVQGQANWASAPVQVLRWHTQGSFSESRDPRKRGSSRPMWGKAGIIDSFALPKSARMRGMGQDTGHANRKGANARQSGVPRTFCLYSEPTSRSDALYRSMQITDPCLCRSTRGDVDPVQVNQAIGPFLVVWPPDTHRSVALGRKGEGSDSNVAMPGHRVRGFGESWLREARTRGGEYKRALSSPQSLVDALDTIMWTQESTICTATTSASHTCLSPRCLASRTWRTPSPSSASSMLKTTLRSSRTM